MQVAVVEDDVLDLFGVDTIQLGCDRYKRPECWKDWVLEDGTPCKVLVTADIRHTGDGDILCNSNGRVLGKKPRGCHYFEQTNYPLEENSDTENFSNLNDILNDALWFGIERTPGQYEYKTPEGAKSLGEKAAALRGSTDRAVYAVFDGKLLETGNCLFRMDNHLLELAANPERMHKFQDTLMEQHMKDLKAYLDAVGDYIDIIGFTDDMGSQAAPLISPAMYREFFFPGHKKMWSCIHERFPDMKICLHCCGSVRPIMPLLVEAGLDAINPVQFTCRDMEIDKLKNEFYGKLTLWGGGCDTREILPNAKPEDIAPHVRKNLNILNKGGGFVFQQIHNIQADVPPENIAAMFEAVRDFV
jgi:uroporphyrinogen decarboxylase